MKDLHQGDDIVATMQEWTTAAILAFIEANGGGWEGDDDALRDAADKFLKDKRNGPAIKRAMVAIRKVRR